ncbi:hypothetical protein YA0002_04635 [Pseudomonas cichorii]|nr:hypothetical protein [Pseudomonas cichorii]
MVVNCSKASAKAFSLPSSFSHCWAFASSVLCFDSLVRSISCMRLTPGDDWAGLISSQPFIRYDRTSFGGRQVDRFLRKMHFTPHEVSELDELDAIVKLVAHGVGVALAPETLGHDAWPEGVRALDLQERTFYREIGLVYHPRRNTNEPVMILAGQIEALARETSSWPAHTP